MTSTGLALSDQQVRLLRLQAQRLTASRAVVTGVADVVRALCSVQAQDMRAAPLAIRARSVSLTARDVDAARLHERSIVRTWVMRGTLHLVAAEDVGWLRALLGPALIAGGRRRRLQLGLDEDMCTRGVQAIQAVLAAEGPLTRAELVERLAQRGIVLDARSQAPIHLLHYAALGGVVCYGPDRGHNAPTYVLLRDWVAPQHAVDAETALGELARRYLQAYGPALLDDFATWAGITLSRARAAWTLIARQIVEVKMAGRSAWLLAAHAAQLDEAFSVPLTVRLLPSFDTYLLGYRQREALVAARFASRVNSGGGILYPIVVVDGRVAGTWRQQRKRVTTLVVDPFEEISAEVQAALEVEVVDVARFLGREAQVAVTA